MLTDIRAGGERVPPSGLTVTDVVGGAISDGVQRLQRAAPVARLGADPEGVHEARVAARRLRSDLRTFAPLLDQDWTAHLRAELAWLGQVLGVARDADILHARLEATSSLLDPDDQRSVATVLERAAHERAAARRQLVAVLDSERYRELVVRCSAAARAPALVVEPDRAAREVLAPLLRRPVDRLRRAVASLPAVPTPAQLHRVRIHAKRARYAAEAVVPVFGGDARRFARKLAGLQEVLGEHQDAMVTVAWLRDAATTVHARDRLAVGQLIGLELARAAAARTEWPRRWVAVERRTPRGWLA